MNYCGIDPGLTGAVIVLDDGLRVIDALDMPCIDKELDATVFIDVFQSWHITHVYIEKAQGMPKQKGMFTYGRLFGEIIGVLKALSIPYTLVTPQAWKKTQLAGMPKEKVSSVIRINQLYPELKLRKTQHGRADAILLCRHGVGRP